MVRIMVVGVEILRKQVASRISTKIPASREAVMSKKIKIIMIIIISFFSFSA